MTMQQVAEDLKAMDEVAELTAMLDGEPRCDITGSLFTVRILGLPISQFRVHQECFNPAKWITKLNCGHPGVNCDMHAPMSSGLGAICGCGAHTPPGDIRWLPL